jgi:predicted RNase H-like HicB family nuclease
MCYGYNLKGIDMRIAVVKAARDLDALVWYVEHSDIEGLHVEGDTFDEFCENVAIAVSDLVEGESDGAEIPIEIIAHASLRARVPA